MTAFKYESFDGLGFNSSNESPRSLLMRRSAGDAADEKAGVSPVDKTDKSLGAHDKSQNVKGKSKKEASKNSFDYF